MHTRFPALLILLFLLNAGTVSPQVNIDSLKALPALTSGTAKEKTEILKKIFDYYADYNSDSAGYYSKKIRGIAEESKNPEILALAHQTSAVCAYNAGDYLKAEEEIKKALSINETGHDTAGIINSLNKLAQYKMESGKYTQALEVLLKHLEIAEAQNNYSDIIASYSNIGMLYSYMEKFDEEIKYYLKALKIIKKHPGLDVDPAPLYQNVGSWYVDYNSDSALYYLHKAIDGFRKSNNYNGLAASCQNIGWLYGYKLSNIDSAFHYFNKTLELSYKLDVKMKIEALLSFGDLYLELKQYKKAEDYFLKALPYAEDAGRHRDKQYILQQLYLTEKGMGRYAKALDYYEKYTTIKDSLDIHQTEVKISGIKEKYESDKKNKEIELLKNQNKLKQAEAKWNRTAFVSAVVLLILTLLIFWTSYQSYRNKQQARHQRLKKEAERRVLSAVIDTEDAERKRIAEDIHDGVNPLLSSVKLYLGEIKFVEKKEEQEQMIRYADELVTDALKQIRNISHNIMPNRLSEKGLIHSLKAFAEKMHFTRQLKITIDNGIGNKRFARSTELVIYRTLIELINNTLKHAKAKNVRISFVQKKKSVSISYRDDGIGFDVVQVMKSQTKGIGLANIKNRIASLNGTMNINSGKGAGTVVDIELFNLVV